MGQQVAQLHDRYMKMMKFLGEDKTEKPSIQKTVVSGEDFSETPKFYSRSFEINCPKAIKEN